jgi:adenosine deaminase
MKSFDPIYNELPKTEIHCHLEGSIRTATILDIACEHHLPLPAYDAVTLDRYVKVYDQLKDLQSVLDAFTIFQDSIASPVVVERIMSELCEDAARQNVRLFEVRFSPDWAFSGHGFEWDAALGGILRAKARAESQFDMAIGLIAITSRSLGNASCEKTVDWAIRHSDVIQGIDLADSEADHPIHEFVRPVFRAKDAGLKVTVHSGEDTPASFVIDTIRAVSPDRIGHGIHIVNDPAAVKLVKERGVTLEVNPWSNFLTNSVQRIEEHPLRRLFEMGVKVTINSDDPELLETNFNWTLAISGRVTGHIQKGKESRSRN